MTEDLAPGLTLFCAFPKYAVNWYLADDVLIDAGTRQDKGRGSSDSSRDAA